MVDRSDTRTVQARDGAAAPIDEDLEVVLEDALEIKPRTQLGDAAQRVCRDYLDPPDTEHAA